MVHRKGEGPQDCGSKVQSADDGRMLVLRNPTGTFVEVGLYFVETSAHQKWTHQIIFQLIFNKRERQTEVSLTSLETIFSELKSKPGFTDDNFIDKNCKHQY